ncbi:ATP synthase F1 subunit gamma [Opitutus terrae]|uniref:ATP synthase gamma chain n=1 Tax=Opitutus terrae (strain DSM 11246 / JCM 15787 / PB90-1) TaxID=452637 RepID=ATPG_OPITP|nr:ATP synthase F1 subunit gamma [Opitutus terrae]B1ZWN7.1 RecName: Full=ATP synthase gamma chain; AltName: Full=ATP synthase F1 sector gamma subunit; AltName: Full=F-ATPase gamma subunit [Opitutus terrae PB90-1]ACB74164.1 ATP synthase F1, gamma subunit [Opitutus terrae PB90-1]
MASTRDIRRRIKSVKNTRQITKAMELVAASKMKKAQQAAVAGRPYAELMAQMLATLGDRVEEAQHPFLVQREVKTRGIILITTDKGLAGPLNANLFKLVTDIQSPAKYVVVGRKGAQFIARTRRDLLAEFQVSDRAAFAEVKVVVEFMTKQFIDGVVDSVEVIWPRFKNTLVQIPTIAQLLPLRGVQHAVESLQHGTGVSAPRSPAVEAQMLFEPDPVSVLSALLPLYINREVYHQVLDAKASEHSARMVAMKTAKDNATKLLDDLTLEYNKARQAGITQEIIEIAAAQFAAAS